MKNTTTRRGFIKQVAATGVGLTIGGMSFKATSAKSYANIMGSNERVNMAVMGTNGRGAGMARNFQRRGNEICLRCGRKGLGERCCCSKESGWQSEDGKGYS